jgi:hypothetical protein
VDDTAGEVNIGSGDSRVHEQSAEDRYSAIGRLRADNLTSSNICKERVRQQSRYECTGVGDCRRWHTGVQDVVYTVSNGLPDNYSLELTLEKSSEKSSVGCEAGQCRVVDLCERSI